MRNGLQPADLGFFSALAATRSLSASARELGITTPAVRQRLAPIESRICMSLSNRPRLRVVEGPAHRIEEVASAMRPTTIRGRPIQMRPAENWQFRNAPKQAMR